MRTIDFKIIFKLLFLFFTLIYKTAYSEPVKILTLEESIHAAINWNPMLRSSKNNLLSSEQDIYAAQGKYYPQISGGLASGYNNGDRFHQNLFSPKGTISVSQTIYDFGKISSEVELAESYHQLQNEFMLNTSDEIVRSTSQAWIELHRQKALVAITLRKVDSIADMVDLATKRYEQGASTMSDVLQAKARFESAKTELINYRMGISRWKNNLSSLIGMDPHTFDIDNYMIKSNYFSCALSDKEIMRTPILQLSEAKQKKAAAELNLATASQYPTITLDSSLNHHLLGYSKTNDNAQIMLNVSSSFFDGGINRAKKRAAEYSLSAANNDIESEKINLVKKLSDYKSQISSQYQRIDTFKNQIDNMQKTRVLYKQQYMQTGDKSLLDLLNADQELYSAEIQKIDSEHDIQGLETECRFSVGDFRKN